MAAAFTSSAIDDTRLLYLPSRIQKSEKRLRTGLRLGLGPKLPPTVVTINKTEDEKKKQFKVHFTVISIRYVPVQTTYHVPQTIYNMVYQVGDKTNLLGFPLHVCNQTHPGYDKTTINNTTTSRQLLQRANVQCSNCPADVQQCSNYPALVIVIL